jgi:hypothetical protein
MSVRVHWLHEDRLMIENVKVFFHVLDITLGFVMRWSGCYGSGNR